MPDDNNRRLIGGIVLAGAVVLGLLALLCGTGVLPVDHGARSMITLAFGIAAAADAAVGLFFLTRTDRS
jgi:hypothetical protein